MPSPGSIFRRFRRANDGVTAIEFALVAPLFFFIFMAIFEVSLMFFAYVNIDGAAIESARLIRTGQAQLGGDPETAFKTELCNQLSTLVNCGKVYSDVQTVSNFSSVSFTVEYDPDTGEPILHAFSAGGAGDIVVVRVMYYWNFFTPWVGSFFEGTVGSNSRLLMATVAFQSEPYE